MHGKMQNKMKMKYFVFCKKKRGKGNKGILSTCNCECIYILPLSYDDMQCFQ